MSSSTTTTATTSGGYIHPELKRWRESRNYREKYDFFRPKYEISNRCPKVTTALLVVDGNNNPTLDEDAALNTQNNNTALTSSTASTLFEVQKEFFSNPDAAVQTLKGREHFLRSQIESQRNEHQNLAENVQKTKARLQALERELEQSERKLQRRDASVRAVFLSLERLANNNKKTLEDRKQTHGSSSSSSSSSWCADINFYLEFLSVFNQIVCDRMINDKTFMFRNLILCEGGQQSGDENDDGFFGFLSKEIEKLRNNYDQSFMKKLCPALEISSSQISFKEPKRNIRQRQDDEQDSTVADDLNNIDAMAEVEAPTAADRLFCELELSARHHFSRLVLSSSKLDRNENNSNDDNHTSTTSNERREIDWSIFCRDFDCPLHHHFEIPRRFAIGLDLLCFLTDQIVQNDNSSTSSNNFFIDAQLLYFIWTKIAEAKTIFEEVQLSSSSSNHHHSHHHHNNNTESDDHHYSGVVELVSNWTLEIANKCYLLDDIASSSSSSTRDKLRSLCSEVKSQEEAKETINSLVGEKLSQINVATLVLMQKDEEEKKKQQYAKTTFSASSSSSSLATQQRRETLLRQLHIAMSDSNKAPNEAFDIACDLVDCSIMLLSLSQQSSSSREEEENKQILHQAVSDTLKIAATTQAHFTSTMALQGDRQTSSDDLRSSLYRVTTKMVRILVKVASSSLESLEFVSNLLLAATNSSLSSLDALSHWNLSVFVVSLHVASCIPSSGSSLFPVIERRFLKLLVSESSLLPLPLTLDTFINVPALLKYNGNLFAPPQRQAMLTTFSKCEAIFHRVESTHFCSTTLVRISEELNFLADTIQTSLVQLRKIFGEEHYYVGASSSSSSASASSSLGRLQSQINENVTLTLSAEDILDFVNHFIFADDRKAGGTSTSGLSRTDVFGHLMIVRRLIEVESAQPSVEITKSVLEEWLHMMMTSSDSQTQQENSPKQSPKQSPSKKPKGKNNKSRLPSPPKNNTASITDSGNKKSLPLLPQQLAKTDFWWNGTQPERLQTPNFFAGEMMIALALVILHKKPELALERLKMRVARAVKHDSRFHSEVLGDDESCSLSSKRKILSSLKDCFRFMSILSSSSSSVSSTTSAAVFACEYLSLVEKYNQCYMILESDDIIEHAKTWTIRAAEASFVERINTFLEGRKEMK